MPVRRFRSVIVWLPSRSVCRDGTKTGAGLVALSSPGIDPLALYSTPAAEHVFSMREYLGRLPPAFEVAIEAPGGSYFFSMGDPSRKNAEFKFKDPEGVVFDISKHGWLGTNAS